MAETEHLLEENKQKEALTASLADDISRSILEVLVEENEKCTVEYLQDEISPEVSQATVYRRFNDHLTEAELVDKHPNYGSRSATHYSANENAERALNFIDSFYDEGIELEYESEVI